eukprot:scaffold274372_cov18-Tisochrysis_lutea.AAC.2
MHLLHLCTPHRCASASAAPLHNPCTCLACLICHTPCPHASSTVTPLTHAPALLAASLIRVLAASATLFINAPHRPAATPKHLPHLLHPSSAHLPHLPSCWESFKEWMDGAWKGVGRINLSAGKGLSAEQSSTHSPGASAWTPASFKTADKECQRPTIADRIATAYLLTQLFLFFIFDAAQARLSGIALKVTVRVTAWLDQASPNVTALPSTEHKGKGDHVDQSRDKQRSDAGELAPSKQAVPGTQPTVASVWLMKFLRRVVLYVQALP